MVKYINVESKRWKYTSLGQYTDKSKAKIHAKIKRKEGYYVRVYPINGMWTVIFRDKRR